MIAFWIGAAAFSAIALWLIVRPLFSRFPESGAKRGTLNVSIYREQLRELDTELANGALTPEQHDAARRELEARLLDDVQTDTPVEPPTRGSRAAAYAVAAVIPIGALALYLTVGTPLALDPQVLAAARSDTNTPDRAQLQALVEKLAARMEAEPENGEGWLMLAKAYRHFGRFGESAKAYAHALGRLPPNAALLTEYADTLGMAQGRNLSGEPEKIIQRALELDPRHLRALALAGSAAYERKDYAAAARYWERMLPLLPGDSDEARTVKASIAEARGLGGLASLPLKSESAPESGARRGGVSGVVKLAPDIASKVAPSDTVFIYARAAEGSRIPLAVVRKQARELPASFTLDDTSAMAPGATLSAHENVVIAARVSKSSTATPQPGDFEGRVGPVKNDARGLTVVIDTAVR